jgi:hypothetical protein
MGKSNRWKVERRYIVPVEEWEHHKIEKKVFKQRNKEKNKKRLIMYYKHNICYLTSGPIAGYNVVESLQAYWIFSKKE